MKLLASSGGPRKTRTVSEQGTKTESRQQRSESVELGDGLSVRMGWEGSDRRRSCPDSWLRQLRRLKHVNRKHRRESKFKGTKGGI